MNKDVQTLTPPSQTVLSDRQEGGSPASRAQLSPSGKKPLFTPASYRRALLDDYPELEHVCDRIGFGELLTLGEWSDTPEWALLELARGAFPPPPALSWDHASADVPELIADLVEGHHRPLRNESRRIGILIEHWSRCESNVENVQLAKRYQGFVDHLLARLDQEEATVFPQCLAIDLANRQRCRGTIRMADVAPAIRALHGENEEMRQSLQQIRKRFDHLTRGHLGTDVTVIRIGLSEMEADLAVHATKESEFLIPAALSSDDQLRGRRCSG